MLACCYWPVKDGVGEFPEEHNPKNIKVLYNPIPIFRQLGDLIFDSK